MARKVTRTKPAAGKKTRAKARATTPRDLPAGRKARKVRAGTTGIPRVGDEVIVSFTTGAVRSPYVVGGLWNGDRPPA